MFVCEISVISVFYCSFVMTRGYGASTLLSR